jgi:hypothetical protein
MQFLVELAHRLGVFVIDRGVGNLARPEGVVGDDQAPVVKQFQARLVVDLVARLVRIDKGQVVMATLLLDQAVERLRRGSEA